MTDESKTQPDQGPSTESRFEGSRPSGAVASTTPPPSKPGLGQPARHDFGDKTDRTSQRIDPTETEDKNVADAGEGHKGPRVDATRPNPDAARDPSDKSAR